MSRQSGVLPDVNDPEFASFWQATKQQRLVIPRCSNCERFAWPPRPICPHCFSDTFEWTAVPATGTIYSWTVVHHQTVDSMDSGYIVAIVEIDGVDGVRLLGNIWDFPGEDLRVGMRLSARFDEMSADCTLVNWSVDRGS